MLNLFQHLTSLACSLFINKTLKKVQDDIIRNSLLNFSTFKLLNLKECAGVNSMGLCVYLQAGKAGVKNA